MTNLARVHIRFVIPLLILMTLAFAAPAEARGSGRRVDPRVPRLLAPTTDQELTIPAKGQTAWLFKWSRVRGANAYHLEVHASALATPILQKRVDTPNYVHIVKAGDAKGAREKGWNWRVRALFNNRPGPWSAWGALTAKRQKTAIKPVNPGGGIVPLNPDQPLVPLAPDAPTLPDTIKFATVPTLLSPAEGATLPNVDQTGRLRWSFRWGAIANAVTYHIEVRRRGAQHPVMSRFVRATHVNYVSTGYIAESLLDDWTFRVRAYRNRKPLGEWSKARTFKVASRAKKPTIDPRNLPKVPVLSTPRAGATLPNADATGRMRWSFSWIGVLPANSYRIQVRKKGATLMLIDDVTDKLTYTHMGEGYIAEANLKGWEWRVQALDRSGKALDDATPWRGFDVAPQ